MEPSTCECQCDIWCKPGQYLDHKNCICKNKLIGRVIEECTSVINETMINNVDDGGKNMSFVTDDEEVYEKYNEIWEVVRKLLKLKFTVGPIRHDKYLIAKLKIFNGTNRTTFTDNVSPIERTSYNCIPAIDIDSVLRIDDKRAYPQAYLEQCKYKLRKRKIVNFIDDEIIDEDSENDSDITEELKL